MAKEASAASTTYRSARLLGVGQRVSTLVVEALAAVEFPVQGRNETESARLAGEELATFVEQLVLTIGGVTGAERDELLEKVDVDFSLRRSMALTYLLSERGEEPGFRALWQEVNLELQLLEIVRSALERVVVPPSLRVGSADFPERVRGTDPTELWGEIQARALALVTDP
jgi:hypothetical protein